MDAWYQTKTLRAFQTHWQGYCCQDVSEANLSYKITTPDYWVYMSAYSDQMSGTNVAVNSLTYWYSNLAPGAARECAALPM